MSKQRPREHVLDCCTAMIRRPWPQEVQARLRAAALERWTRYLVSLRMESLNRQYADRRVYAEAQLARVRDEEAVAYQL